MEQANLISVFLTGLFTGGLTCLAVQGGLLATCITQRQNSTESTSASNALPIATFLGAKLIAYTILGFLLGWLGSVLQLSLSTRFLIQLGVGIFMLGTALNLLQVHPFFRYFSLQPPRFLTRAVRKQSKSQSLFTPAVLGAFTVAIPCGTTQAMMALAIASSSPFLGGSIMFAFVLGTSPLFFTLGYFASRLGEIAHQRFTKITAGIIIFLALYTINGAIALSGVTVDFNFGTKATLSAKDAVSQATILLERNGYSPSSITVKAGKQVKLNLVNENGAGCIQAFTIPALGIQTVIPQGTSNSISFTAPNDRGQIAFTCSMGMYGGTINVI